MMCPIKRTYLLRKALPDREKEVEKMRRIDLLIQTDTLLTSRLIIHLGRMFDNPGELQSHLEGEVTEKELQQINDAARKEGRQPLSFSFKQ